MPRRYHFVQADVFTDRAFGGNQLAVFTDARGLSDQEMQTLAREMNYSESTFIFPPEVSGAAKRIRIFTPGRELPVAGHPTVGTAHVLAHRGEIPLTGAITEAVLQLPIGPTPIHIESQNGEPQFVWMTHRPAEFGASWEDRAQVAHALGVMSHDLHADLPIQKVSTGVPFLFVPLRSLEAIGQCRVNESALRDLFNDQEPMMVYLFTTETTTPQTQFHVRMFGPHIINVPEDPATGVAAAPLGAYAARYGLLPNEPQQRFIIEQGIEMGRPSQIHVEVKREGEQVTSLRIGGQTVIVGEGEIFWD